MIAPSVSVNLENRVFDEFSTIRNYRNLNTKLHNVRLNGNRLIIQLICKNAQETRQLFVDALKHRLPEFELEVEVFAKRPKRKNRSLKG
ncbi:hypothetical protein HOF56_04240 [Candidatus Peribacteria bacterium]|jgi:hypothetical protein|nr:hypothetical protein [Candidatus Peribacteria bacterium]MBT4021002.1 hypothetical protein [Candidatus Peribacteria bacterium]MBT4240901.1 hypothetical protein [Candidatus Peribacteria bacterium]MBT4474124.1 hypothetical protein [Candidatus Peribacteria bacterium]